MNDLTFGIVFGAVTVAFLILGIVATGRRPQQPITQKKPDTTSPQDATNTDARN
jgi:hypothetical protein